MKRVEIDSKNLPYRELNERIHQAIRQGAKEIVLRNVNGQRYIGDGVQGKIRIEIEGVAGNDLAAFMEGPTIVTSSNAQDAVANTMNAGKVIIHGNAGDVIGYGMRGGKLFIRGNVGYRVGIHMKSYKKKTPVIIIGETARDFLGEYQAGGVIILLGLNGERPLTGRYTGTGMHGGVIYLRGNVEPFQLGKEVSLLPVDKTDEQWLRLYLREYCEDFGLSLNKVMDKEFFKLLPTHLRPYGRIYAY